MADDIRVRYSPMELREFLREVRRHDAVKTAGRVDDGDTVTGTYGASAIIIVRTEATNSGWDQSRYEEVLPEEYEWSRHEPYEGRATDGTFEHAIVLPVALDSE